MPSRLRTLACTGSAALRLVTWAASALAGPAAAGEPPEAAVLATLPFDAAAHPMQIVIDLAPEGNARRLPFQLDTGATGSVVTPQLARAMGVRVSAIKGTPYRRRTALGRDVQFVVDTRRSDTRSASGIEFGLLGGDFLSDYVVELDLARHRVRFLDPERWAAFVERYFAELDGNPEAWRPLLEAARSRRGATLLFAARDAEHNNATALKRYLESKDA